MISENFYNISKSKKYHTPDQYPTKKSISYFSQYGNPKNIINKNQNIYNINLNQGIHHITENEPDESYSFIEPNDIDLLNEKIISQKKNILYLKSRLGNYNNIKKEISRLNQELNKVDEAIKIKNDIISEYQLLSEIAKNKFANYINKSDSKLKEYNKKMLNIPDLQKENNDLTQKILILLNENKKLKQKYEEMELYNKKEIDYIQNDIINLKNNFENIIKENDIIKKENINSDNEIENLRKQLLLKENYESELDDINKKCFLLENQINKKENTIENLQKINEVLKKKLNSTNDDYNKILNKQNKQKSLQEKIKKLESLCEEYELAFRKLKKSKSLCPIINKNKIYDNNNYNRNYSNRNKNIIFKRYNSRIFYKYNNDKKIIENKKDIYNDMFNEFKDNSVINYDYYNLTDTTNNNTNKNKKNNYKNNKLKSLTQRNKEIDINIKNKKNKKNKINLNDNNFTLQPSQFLDKSFGYSNYLLDNLKNKISQIHFDTKY